MFLIFFANFQKNRYQLKILCTYLSASTFSYIIRLLSKKKFMENFGSHNFPFFAKFPKIRNSKYEIAVWYPCSIYMFRWKPVGSSLKLHSWRRFPHTLISDRKRDNMTSLWRHSRPTYQRPGRFLLPCYVKWMKEKVCKVWWRYCLSCFFF